MVPEGHRLARVLARRGGTLLPRGAPAPVDDPSLAAALGSAMSAEPEGRPDAATLCSTIAAHAASDEEIAGFARSVVGEAALGHGRE